MRFILLVYSVGYVMGRAGKKQPFSFKVREAVTFFC